MNTIKVIYITNPSEEDAQKIACHLLEKKLIACANLSPIDSSMYWWHGALEQSNKYVLIVKTTEENYQLVKNEVERVHAYAVPCIIGMSCQVNENYFKFIQESVLS